MRAARETMAAAAVLAGLVTLGGCVAADTVTHAPETAETAQVYRAESLADALVICGEMPEPEQRPCIEAAYDVTWRDWTPTK